MNFKFSSYLVVFLLLSAQYFTYSQNVIENYQPKKNDSLRVGIGEKDFFPLIQKGYTLMLPEKQVKGVLIFLEDSQFDSKNKSAKQVYEHASKNDFAVLSVSTEIPLDFYFTEASLKSVHEQIQDVFKKYNLPNKNIFFLGASLVGHRSLKYIEYSAKNNRDFKLNINGVVLCNFTLDWTRKWYQHQRDIRLNLIDLWEPKFMNYMLETYLKGTPETVPNNYHNFSTYSFFDKQNRNINIYKEIAVRAYAEPSIKHRLKKYKRTLYENNTTDIVGFIAELELTGNNNTDLIMLYPNKDLYNNYTSQSTWNKIDKVELFNWINKNSKN